MEKQRWEESEQRQEEDQRREGVRRKKIKVREKVEKSRHALFFLMFLGSASSNNRLAKAGSAEPSRQLRNQKLHAAVARSTCGSQNAERRRFWALLDVQLSFYVAGAMDSAPC